MPAWPSDLPEFVQSSASETLEPGARIEGQSEMNKTTTRRRVKGRVRAFECAIAVTVAELATFEAFYLDDLGGGVLPFTWVHPRTRAAATFRFSGPPPKLSPRASGAMTIVSFNLTQVS